LLLLLLASLLKGTRQSLTLGVDLTIAV